MKIQNFNKKQKVILIIALTLTLFVCFYPPKYVISGEITGNITTYSDNDTQGDISGDISTYHFRSLLYNFRRGGGVVDTGQIFIELILIWLISGGLVIFYNQISNKKV
ncbi:MAG: hypothetical protein V1779_02465 [bacterium]